MQDEGLKAIQNLEAAFKECDRVVETGDKQAVPSAQQNALTYVGQIEEAMMKGFPFTVPSQYDNLPQLKVSLYRDQGGELQGESKLLLERCGIDHRKISPYHPQANGLTGRGDQTITKPLTKLRGPLYDRLTTLK